MTASSPRGPLTDGPRDPEHDPRASWALEPDYVARLTARVVATPGAQPTHEVRSPLDDAPLAQLPQSTPLDVGRALATARRVQEAWSRTSAAERSRMMLRFHDLVLDRQDEITELVCLESGKARKDAYLEVAHVAMTARYYARTSASHLATRRVPGMFPALTRVDVNRIPKGVVGIISP